MHNSFALVVMERHCITKMFIQKHLSGKHISFSCFSGSLLTSSRTVAWSFGENDKRLQLLLVPLPHSEGTALGLQGPNAQRRCWTLFGCKETQEICNKNATKMQINHHFENVGTVCQLKIRTESDTKKKKLISYFVHNGR